MRLGQGCQKAQNDIPFNMEGWTLRLATIVPQIVPIITTKYSQNTPDIHVHTSSDTYDHRNSPLFTSGEFDRRGIYLYSFARAESLCRVSSLQSTNNDNIRVMRSLQSTPCRVLCSVHSRVSDIVSVGLGLVSACSPRDHYTWLHP